MKLQLHRAITIAVFLGMCSEVMSAPITIINSDPVKKVGTTAGIKVTETVNEWSHDPASFAETLTNFSLETGKGQVVSASTTLINSFMLNFASHPYFKGAGLVDYTINQKRITDAIAEKTTKMSFSGLAKDVAIGLVIDLLTDSIREVYGNKIAGGAWFAMKESVALANAGAKGKGVAFTIALTYEQASLLADVVQKDIEEYGKAKDAINDMAASQARNELFSFESSAEGKELIQKYNRETDPRKKSSILEVIKSKAYLSMRTSVPRAFDILSPDRSDISYKVFDDWASGLEGRLIKSIFEVQVNVNALVYSGKYEAAKDLAYRNFGTTVYADNEIKSVEDMKKEVEPFYNGVINEEPILDNYNSSVKVNIVNNSNVVSEPHVYAGYVAGKASGISALFTGHAKTASSGTTPINRGATNTLYSNALSPNVKVSVNSSSQGGYSYTDWGEWSGAGITIPAFGNASAERGLWVVGQLSNESDMPKTGTATYNGNIKGIAMNGENIGGTVNLNANFTNRDISGAFNLSRQSGADWVSLRTGSMSFSRTSTGTGFNANNLTVRNSSGNSIAGAGAEVGGSFFGTNAQEVAGEWAVWNTPDSVGGADGIFRAKK